MAKLSLPEEETARIRREIYAPPPVTLAEKLADYLAGWDEYVVITKGTRTQYLIQAQELLDFIKENSDG